GSLRSVSGGTGDTSSGAADVPVEANISVAFSNDIDTSTLTTGTFKVVRADTGEVLDGTISYEDKVATFIPARTCVFNDSGTYGITYKGLKQDTAYTVTLASAGIRNTSGTAEGAADTSFSFTTVDLDYGFFFLGSQGEYQKAVAGVTNAYYDSAKPTVIFFHGWQSGSTDNDFDWDNPFFYYSSKIPAYNAVSKWRDAGWNVCIANWAQFADEGEVKDAQAKLWLGDSDRKDMRYRVREDSVYVQYDKTRSVTDLFYDQYVAFFKDYSGGNIRFLGHSLGNQAATLLAYKISCNINSGNIDSYYMPGRIVLLDPFWGNNKEACCGNMWVGEQCVNYMTTMLTRDSIALEEYRTSWYIGSYLGDSLLNMRKRAAYYRITPGSSVLSSLDVTDLHSYAYNWYALSIDKIVYADKTPGSNGIGALTGDETVKSIMNWDFTANAVRSTLYKYTNNAGASTVTPTDDSFTRKSGVAN
ncbi:MAG: Ig-like domain-containing protein, partial [Spirochaetota bacterium]